MAHRRTHLAASISATFLVLCVPAQAQNVVDPSKVAPEFREAAEKRRAEQLKLIACNKAAVDAKVQPRDRPDFMARCFDNPDHPASDISAATRK